MRIFVLILLFVLGSQAAYSQPRIFNSKFGYFDYIFQPVSQLVDSSGNHYIMGRFNGVQVHFGDTIQSRGDNDIYLLKYDSQNNFQWIKTYGSAALDNPKSMSCDRDGNIYLIGDFTGSSFYASETLTLNYITGYQQSKFLIKVSPLGNTVWASRYSGSSAADDSKSEVFNDHDGRLYFILASRANGALSSWRYNDSTIANPSNLYINVPRWMMVRVNPSTGQIVWLDYIANPRIGSSIITYLYISKPQVDRQNNILFAVSYFGNHIDPIYIFGQYAALNPNYNNVLVKIDSNGLVKRFRDLGASNSSKSDVTDLALTKYDEPVLINKKALINTDGFNIDYSQSNNYNFVRVYDTSFTLNRIIRIGNQSIGSFLFDKNNRLLTLSTTSAANFGQPPVTETIILDSTSSVNINTESQVYQYLIRYKNNFIKDTFFIEQTRKPYTSLTLLPNMLKLSHSGNITLATSYPLYNNVVLRYDSNFLAMNINYGQVRDIQENILGMGEDSLHNTYISGIMHLRTDISTAQGDSTYTIPSDQSIDIFVAKFNPSGNLVWLRRIGKVGTDSYSGMAIGRDGIYLAVTSTVSSNWQYDSTNQYFSGRANIIKINFTGDLIWQKEVSSTNIANLSISNLYVLKNGKLLVAGRSTGQVTFGTTTLPALGNTYSQFVALLDPNNGSVASYNRFSLSTESLGNIARFSSGLHEDDFGNLFFGIYTSITNINSSTRATELYSLRQNRIPFNQIWVNQQGIMKLDSTLELKKFNTFRSYFGLGNVAGLKNDVYFTAYARGSSFAYDTITGLATIPLHGYATNSHFINFTAKLDTALRIKNLVKFDTTSVETGIDINSRKLVIDSINKVIYETVALLIPTRIDSSNTLISNLGGRDLFFLKYDSVGKLMGGVRLGTPQSDNITAAYSSSTGFVFASQAVNPNYVPQYLQMQNAYVFRNSLNNFPASSLYDFNRINSIGRISAIDSSLLVPDNYLSKYRSLSEIGRPPNTLFLAIGDTVLCSGQLTYLKVNTATGIQWLRNGQIISGATSDSLPISLPGSYKAILTTAEGRIDSTQVINITVNANPSLPVVSGVSYCVGSSASALSATALSGHELLWYGVSSTGGTSTSSAPVPSTSASGVTTYYVSQRSVSTGCESGRSSLVVTVNANPSLPVVSGVSYCVGSSASALSATALSGHELLWYGVSSTGGTSTSSAPVPSTSASGVTTYYVSQRSVSTGCESGRSSLVVTVNANPSLPVVSGVSYCVGSSASALSATALSGHELLWYGVSSTGGTSTSSAPVPSTSASGVTTYYVSQRSVSTGCESGRSSLVVTVNANPSLPVVSGVSYCVGSSASALSATALSGHELLWYGVSSTGGTSTSSAPVPSTSASGVTTYYVSQRSVSTGCESGRSSLVVTVNANPSLPVVSGVSYCVGSSASALSATALSGHELLWYGVSSTGGTSTSSAPVPSTSASGVTTYYVSQRSVSTGCESGRSSLVVTVNANPSLPVVSGVSYCVGSSASALSATALSGHELLWYGVSSTGGTSTSSAPVPSTSASGVTTYYVSQRSVSTGCESGRSSLVVTVNANPSLPVVSGVSYCVGSSASALSATALSGHELLWYGVSSTGGTSTSSAPVPSTSASGVTTYYVSQRSVSTGCESGRSSLVVTVNANPPKPLLIRNSNNFLISSSSVGNNWFKDGLIINAINTQEFKPLSSGWYSVQVSINGCQSQISEPFYFLATPLITFDQSRFFGFYPNPAADIIKIAFQLNDVQTVRIKIYDSQGRKIIDQRDVINGGSINVSRLSSGHYFIQVEDNQANLVYSGGIIKN